MSRSIPPSHLLFLPSSLPLLPSNFFSLLSLIFFPSFHSSFPSLIFIIITSSFSSLVLPYFHLLSSLPSFINVASILFLLSPLLSFLPPILPSSFDLHNYSSTKCSIDNYVPPFYCSPTFTPSSVLLPSFINSVL